jgi:hypothetical protein
MCCRKERNQFFTGQDSVKRVCYSLKSRDKTILEVSGGGENEEEETSVRRVEKRRKRRDGEFQGDGEEERG